ncbi:MAG: CPBP family intramembrane metalloprotease [Bacteroidales bacterium]|nr:CPBP family intramembrane metalloprotease [Bacteroidales bacterium]
MKRFLKPIIAAVMYPLSQLIIGVIMVIVMLAASVDGSVNANDLADYTMPLTLAATLGSGLFAALFAWRPLKMYTFANEYQPAGLKPYIAILIIPAVFLGIFALDLIQSYLDLPNLIEDVMKSASLSAFGFIVISLLGPIFEELIFRSGALGYMLRKGVDGKVAVVVSALLFGLIHINPAQIFVATFIGVVLGVIYYKTRNVILTTIIHVINNTIACLGMIYLPEEQDDELLHEIIGIAPTVFIIVAGIAICAFALARMPKTEKAKTADNQLIANENTTEDGTN